MAKVGAEEINPLRLAQTLHRLGRRRFGEVTLTPSVAATVVDDVTVTENSGVFLAPRTSNATAEMHASPYCLVTVSRGSFSIAHNSNLQADRTFFWSAAGD